MGIDKLLNGFALRLQQHTTPCRSRSLPPSGVFSISVSVTLLKLFFPCWASLTLSETNKKTAVKAISDRK